jgi:hypothetical protein
MGSAPGDSTKTSGVHGPLAWKLLRCGARRAGRGEELRRDAGRGLQAGQFFCRAARGRSGGPRTTRQEPPLHKDGCHGDPESARFHASSKGSPGKPEAAIALFQVKGRRLDKSAAKGGGDERRYAARQLVRAQHAAARRARRVGWGRGGGSRRSPLPRHTREARPRKRKPVHARANGGNPSAPQQHEALQAVEGGVPRRGVGRGHGVLGVKHGLRGLRGCGGRGLLQAVVDRCLLYTHRHGSAQKEQGRASCAIWGAARAGAAPPNRLALNAACPPPVSAAARPPNGPG